MSFAPVRTHDRRRHRRGNGPTVGHHTPGSPEAPELSTRAGGSVSAAAFSPDGGTVATGTTDGAIPLWDVTAPTRPTPVGEALVGHTAATRTAAFSARGGVLATASDDGTIRLWPLGSGSVGRVGVGGLRFVRSCAVGRQAGVIDEV
ncbi:hypothetical protein ABZ923_00385 [Streptomyces sp. NPDC046881]|uniref:WD40 repeat domain-containing protein n=1 Tax=Streptomyces sp. NPDC046881 TaxID=3155374 RepID=UPI0034102EB2